MQGTKIKSMKEMLESIKQSNAQLDQFEKKTINLDEFDKIPVNSLLESIQKFTDFSKLSENSKKLLKILTADKN
jgi:hypothetical protein